MAATPMKTCSIKLENRSRRFWVMVILLLMGINLGIAMIAVKMAIGDVSIRPMPDYGEQAVTWQERIDALNKSKALAWTCQITKPSDASVLRMDLRDKDGKPIQGCTGQVRAFHFTSAGKRQLASLETTQTDDYQVAIDLMKPGLWQIAMTLRTVEGVSYVSDETWYLKSSGELVREKANR
jgi:nitrogen fixation protein FixH